MFIDCFIRGQNEYDKVCYFTCIERTEQVTLDVDVLDRLLEPIDSDSMVSITGSLNVLIDSGVQLLDSIFRIALRSQWYNSNYPWGSIVSREDTRCFRMLSVLGLLFLPCLMSSGNFGHHLLAERFVFCFGSVLNLTYAL